MLVDIPYHTSLKIDCRECWDTGLAPRPANRGRCAVCTESKDEPNAAALLLAQAIRRRMQAEQPVDERPFQLACLLTHFSTKKPIPRAPLQELMEIGERDFKKVVEVLRRDWLLPIGSRKGRPNGYWIITNEDDFLRWHQHFRQQALTEFSTANKLMERNFPNLVSRQTVSSEL